MVATVGVNLRGGLGNRIFLAAAAHGLAASTGRVAVLAGAEISSHSGRTYVDTVFGDFARRQGTNGTVEVVEPANRCLTYDGPLAQSVPPEFSVHLTGYFQDERYLEGHGEEFVKRLRLPSVAVEHGTLFMHVRRGDYLRDYFHAVDLTGYFARAVELAKATFGPQLVRILAFSDDP